MLLTANWRDEIREFWGIRILREGDQLTENTLWVTRCSKIKNAKQSGKPKELYVSLVNGYFYRCMELRGFRYGVLSDKYGLHFDYEILPCYDVHPSLLNQHDKKQLGLIIRDKAQRHGFDRLIFYNPSPLMSVPYFEMLYHSGLEVLYTTQLLLSVV